MSIVRSLVLLIVLGCASGTQHHAASPQPQSPDNCNVTWKDTPDLCRQRYGHLLIKAHAQAELAIRRDMKRLHDEWAATEGGKRCMRLVEEPGDKNLKERAQCARAESLFMDERIRSSNE